MSSTLTRRGRVVLLAGTLSVGLVGGGVLWLGAKAPGGTTGGRAPPGTTAPAGTAASPPSSSLAGAPTIPDMLLAWTPGGLAPRFAERVARFPGVDRLVAVVSGTAWLTHSFDEHGHVVDHPPPGYAIPLEVAAADPQAYAPFVSAEDRALLSGLARGEAALGATSAKLRRLGPGGALAFGDRRVPVAGILPDAAMGAHEVFVSTRTAAALGVTRTRYLLIDPAPGASRSALTERIRSLLPAGAPLRVRGLGETPFFRQGDAVLPPIAMKRAFGEFAAQPLSNGFLRVDPSWQAGHIVDAEVPILGHVQCNRALIPMLRGAMEEVARQGLDRAIDPHGYGGCYVPRFISEDPTGDISHHSWGAAIDFNVPENPFGAAPRQDPRLVAIFEEWGFTWGGRWLVPDGMHFEFSRFPSG
jgi:hypothetical protein